MKMKKDLLTSAVNEVINTATQEPPQAAAAPETLQTSETPSNGRSFDGTNVQRASMAFSAINYDFIKTLSRARGETYTEFVNLIIDEYRKQHQAQYEIALKLRASF